MWRHLRDLLSDRIRATPWQSSLDAARVLTRSTEALRTLLPAELTPHVQATAFRRGVLTLNASHPAVVEHLRMHKQEVLEHLSRAEPAIHDLHILVRRTRFVP